MTPPLEVPQSIGLPATPFLRRLAQLAGLITLLVFVGTFGFVVIEDVSPWRGFVWTLDTIATVGSVREPSDAAGQALKVVLTILGVGTLFYALVTVTDFFVAGHLSGLLAARRMQKTIDSLSEHYIVCGFGRVGRQIARDLAAAGMEFVIVDDNSEVRELATAAGMHFIEGLPSADDTMRAAGIDRAKAVLACVDSDPENIFIALTARGLRDDIRIVARASEEDAESKLVRAGADRVISPYKASGAEMARLVLHPHVSGVVEVAAEYQLEEIEVSEGAAATGRKLGDVRGGALIVALRRRDGTFQVQPPSETILEVGDVLVTLGTRRILERLEAMFRPAG